MTATPEVHVLVVGNDAADLAVVASVVAVSVVGSVVAVSVVVGSVVPVSVAEVSALVPVSAVGSPSPSPRVVESVPISSAFSVLVESSAHASANIEVRATSPGVRL